MYASGGDRELREHLSRAQGDLMDGAAEQSFNNRGSFRNLSRAANDANNHQSTVPSSPPVFPSLATGPKYRTNDTTEWHLRAERESNLLSNLPDGLRYDNSTKDIQSTKFKCLEADNAELAQALLAMEKELNAAKQATHDLAAWAFEERSRLMAEALHQRLLREDYEATLHQRDEQLGYLLALHQEAKLDLAGTLLREGQVMGRSASTEDLVEINKIRAQAGLPPADQYGALAVVRPRGNQPDETPDSGLPGEQNAQEVRIDGMPLEAQWAGDSYIGESARCSVPTESYIRLCDSAEEPAESQAPEESEVFEDEESAYSPPDAKVSESIIDQVDAMIAEEKGRLARW
ncbi:hypothetical protein N0V86_002771 [Didymella sp. IMI 355093]|nr:hypothetical protein N0V86_002771 [Didymella sp. IMI 355093]